jgi:hypothetical protein
VNYGKKYALQRIPVRNLVYLGLGSGWRGEKKTPKNKNLS